MNLSTVTARQNMQPSLRLALRIARRRAIFSGKWKTARIYGRALRDGDMQDEILERLIDSRGEEISATAIGDGTFLKWLMENILLILEMIKTIIDLFTQSSIAADD